MSRFTKKILVPITQEMYSELLARSKANGTSINAEVRMAVSKTTAPKPLNADSDIDSLFPDSEEE